MGYRSGLLIVLLSTCLPLKADLTAERISAHNLDQRVRGSSAVAGLGDWMLSNGTLCASVSDSAHETYLSHRGGSLVDLGFCGRKDDQWHTWHQLFNMSRDQILAPEQIKASVEKGVAKIIVSGRQSGVEYATSYSLDNNELSVLHIETVLKRVKQGEPFSLFGELTLHPLRALSPFVLSTSQPELSKGFQHPFAETDNALAMLDVMFPSDVHILVGAAHLKPQISYGIKLNEAYHIKADGTRRAVKQFAINDAEFTMLGVFANPLFFKTEGKPGLMQFVQMPLMDLEVGESLRLNKSITVAPSVDVQVIAQDMDIEVPGDLMPEAKETEKAFLDLPTGKTMQLVFKGMDETADPVFEADDLNFKVGSKKYYPDISSNRVSLLGNQQDPKQISLKPGKYKVYAYKGLEFGLEKTEIELEADQVFSLNIDEPVRSVETKDWLSADFHVHTEFSFDSTLPIKQQLANYYTAGGEVMVASEHKRTVDIAPYIEQMGLENKLVSIPGVELTGMAHTPKIPRTIGHSNVFPVKVSKDEFMGGTLPHENLRLGEIIGAYKQQNQKNIFQLNHARGQFQLDADVNYLNHLSVDQNYQTEKSLEDQVNLPLLETHEHSHYRDIDFDAMELLNGNGYKNYQLLKKDWFAFLKQGFVKIATANSDSHSARKPPTVPRNYVQVSSDDLANFDQDHFIDAVLAGKLFGTTGPIVDVELVSEQGEVARLGETYTSSTGNLILNIQAADWVNVGMFRIYVNGSLYSEQLAEPGVHPYPMQFTRSGFVTVEVQGKTTKDYAAVHPGHIPFAFTNPIFVDLKK